VIRLLLVRHAPTAASERHLFPGDEPLREPVRVGPLAAAVPAGARVLSSPALRCRQTAAAGGLAARVEPRLAECDFGAWAGLGLAEVGDAGPWLEDPHAAPPGGESLSAFHARVGGWLEQVREDTVAITHAGVIKSAVVSALGAPFAAYWRIACEPLSLTELQRHAGSWTLARLGGELP
jgi:broad specificity phosphatase PhoE